MMKPIMSSTQPNPPTPSLVTSINNGVGTQLQMLPQQPPTPGGQPAASNQMPFMFGPSQQQQQQAASFNMSQPSSQPPPVIQANIHHNAHQPTHQPSHQPSHQSHMAHHIQGQSQQQGATQQQQMMSGMHQLTCVLNSSYMCSFLCLLFSLWHLLLVAVS